jgi:hypothetical protein
MNFRAETLRNASDRSKMELNDVLKLLRRTETAGLEKLVELELSLSEEDRRILLTRRLPEHEEMLMMIK